MIFAPCHINYEPFLIARKSEKMPATLAELLRKSSRYCRHECVGKWNDIVWIKSRQKKNHLIKEDSIIHFLFVAMSQHHIFRWHVAFAPNNILIKKKSTEHNNLLVDIHTWINCWQNRNISFSHDGKQQPSVAARMNTWQNIAPRNHNQTHFSSSWKSHGNLTELAQIQRPSDIHDLRFSLVTFSIFIASTRHHQRNTKSVHITMVVILVPWGSGWRFYKSVVPKGHSHNLWREPPKEILRVDVHSI